MPIAVSQAVAQVPVTDAQSPDGRIRATVTPGSAGVFIRVDYTSMLTQVGYSWPNPFQVTIWRQIEGQDAQPVRGAEGIYQYGAIFHAYDDEVTFGQAVAYWAEAPTASGDQLVETDHVVVRTWEPDGGFTQPGVWIKNLEDPDLSVPARCIDWSAGSWASRNATADVWGSAQPAVTTDVRKSYNTKMTVLTKDEDEYQALLAAIDSSVVYVVGLERHRRRTGYYLIGDIAPSRIGRASSDYDSWDIGLTGMGRPSSAGHSLSVPGKSYADRRRALETYQRVLEAPGLGGYRTENRAKNPSLENGLTDTVTYNSATRALTGDAHSGTQAVACTQAAATTFSGNQWLLATNYTEGQQITASCWVKAGTGVTTVFFSFRFSTTTVGVTPGSAVTLGQWTRVNATYTVPAGQTIDRIACAANGSVGAVCIMDDFMAEQGATLHSYGDGRSGLGWQWSGAANASASAYTRHYGAGTEPF